MKMRNTLYSKETLVLRSLLLCLSFGHFTLVTSETLRGTTILNWPYVNRLPNGQFEGYCIDLLNEIAPLMGMAYTLSPVADGQYGGWVGKNGSVNGMVGEVMRGEADFAIGDLTVLTNRVRFVDFSIPFLEYGLAALVRKDVIASSTVRTFKDLSEQTDIRYGVKRVGANLPLFHTSPVVAKMYSFMDTHPSVFVDGDRDGVEKVKRDRYAFIAESPFVEYVVQRDCSLAAIDDRRKHFQFEFAVAVPLNSPLKSRFSRAIRTLKKSGRLQELKDKYWRSDKCVATGATDSVLTKPANNRPSSSNDVNFVPKANNRTRTEVDIQKDKIVTEPSGAGSMNADVHYPHDEVDDDDVELVKPRPDTRNRRPINRRDNNAHTAVSASMVTCLVVMTLTWLGTVFTHYSL